MTQAPSQTSSAPALNDDLRILRLLVEGVTDYAIYMLDPSGCIQTWNAGGERIKGYRAEDVLGQHFRMFYTEEDRAAGVPERNLAIAAEEGRYAGEGWRRRRDGSLFWASVVIDAIHDEGKFIGFAKITRDISERYEAQKELENAHQAMVAAQRMEAVGRLTLGVAHDFNNLLGVIINSVELAATRVKGDARLGDMLDTAIRAAERGALLTRQLLAFSRAQPLSPEAHSLSQVLEQSADLLRRACGPRTSCQFPWTSTCPSSSSTPRNWSPRS